MSKNGRAPKILRTKDGLTPDQEKFCKLFASDKEFFGNGVQSYIEIYEPDKSKPNWYDNARSAASELLTKPNVYKRISDLLELNELNDNAVDQQMAFVIHQYKDLSAKMKGIAEYNKLKGRIITKISQDKPFEFIIKNEY